MNRILNPGNVKEIAFVQSAKSSLVMFIYHFLALSIFVLCKHAGASPESIHIRLSHN